MIFNEQPRVKFIEIKKDNYHLKISKTVLNTWNTLLSLKGLNLEIIMKRDLFTMM